MKDFIYVRDFDLWRYLRYGTSIFVVLTLAFAVMAAIQAQIVYPEYSLLGDTGCGGNGGVPLDTTCGYFLNNASVSLVAWLGGLAVIGPFWVIWENAMNIGGYIGVHVAAGDISGLAFLVPHGIFEFPAIFLTIACGLYLTDTVIKSSRRDVTYSVVDSVKKTIPVMLVVLGLLGVAGFIESNISPVFAEWVGGFF